MAAWNAMDGKIDWVGLEVVAEKIGINDIELLIDHLQLIQDSMREE